MPQKYRGVSFYKPTGKYLARARGIHLGYYPSSADAAQAYNAYASSFFGDKAILNKIYGRGTPTHWPEPAIPPKTSRFRGVSKSGNRWACAICINNERVFLGRFKKEIEAAQAYNRFCVDNDIITRLNDII